MSGIAIGAVLATVFTAPLSMPTLAETQQERLPIPQSDGRPTTLRPEDSRQYMTLIDGPPGGGTQTRARHLHVSLDTPDNVLSIDFTRISSHHHPSLGGGADKYKIRQIGLTGRLPISTQLDLLATGDLAYMSQKLRTIPASYNKGSTYAWRAGVGVGGEHWSLTAQYERVASKAGLQQMHRMAELLGGAPLARKGVALELQNVSMLSERNRLRLGLTGRLCKSPQRDLELIGASATGRQEKQALVTASLSF